HSDNESENDDNDEDEEDEEDDEEDDEEEEDEDEDESHETEVLKSDYEQLAAHEERKHKNAATIVNGAEPRDDFAERSKPKASDSTETRSSVSDKPSTPIPGNGFEMKPSLLAGISLSTSKQVNSSMDQLLGASTTDSISPANDPVSAEIIAKPKKKTVTFHSTLETSDENMVKKVYNPAIVPLIPIIKKECLARPIRLKKSFNRKMKKRLQRLAMQAAAASSKAECIVRPSRLTEIVLKSSKLDDVTSSSAGHSQSSFTPSISDANNDDPAGSGSSRTSGSDCLEARNLESGGTQFGDKRFILPKRSAHSSRVIKPNKRFLDEFELEIKKKNKAQAAAAAAAASEEDPECSGVDNIAGDKNNFFREKSDKIHQNEDDKCTDDGILEKVVENRKKRDKIKKDSDDACRRTMQPDSKGIPEPADNERPRPPSSVSNPFAKNNLIETGISTGQLMKPSALSGNTPSLSTTSSLTSNLASTVSIFGKSILRQPRLQFTTSLLNSNPLAVANGNAAKIGPANAKSESLSSISTPAAPTPSPSTGQDGPFSLHLNTKIKVDSSNIFSSTLSTALSSTVTTPSCNICGIASNTKYYPQPAKKFGVSCCDICRKFISKMVKKLAGSGSPNGNITLKCKNDGQCSIVSPTIGRTEHMKTRHIFKERCHACWLKKCLSGFLLPPVLKLRLLQTLPHSLRQMEPLNSNSNEPSNRKETVESIFTNPLANNSRIMWKSMEKSEFSKTSPFHTLSNPLVQNNTTFGSVPPIKLNIPDKPPLLAPSTLSSPKERKSIVSVTTEESMEAKSSSEKIDNTGEPSHKSMRSKVKPDTVEVPQPIASIPTTAVPNVAETSTAQPPIVDSMPNVEPSTTMSNEKRQRIDLKGPRVKHVCRSASIVLGQPMATFPEDGAATIDHMETPPSDSTSDVVVDMSVALARVPTVTAQPGEEHSCLDCNEANNFALSPPATPADMDTSGSTEKDLVIDEDQLLPDSAPSSPTKELQDMKPEPIQQPIIKVEIEVKEKDTAKKIEEAERPATRKATSSIRPQVVKQNMSAITKSFNTNVRTSAQSIAPEVPSVPLISIDFWENYDPAEVSRTGFGLILSEEISLKALCFLCGSSGLDEMLYCVCCCEPYHQYCVKDEYNIRHISLDETNMSLLELTTTTNFGNSSPQQQALNKFNWMCPRCTVCYTCNMATGSKVKCQKCNKNYHTTCLGTSKRLLGADRPLICAACLKCKSCSTTNVTKFIGNLPMCTPCFRLRQKGNFCPLCQRCYEDNDFDLKMMECGDCQRWVHAKCEGLTDEQYNMLSALPENIEFICKKCGKNNDTANVWRDAVAAEFKAGLLSVVKSLSKSRQACALLKLSPRKKTSNCSCSISSGKSITFFGFTGSKEESVPKKPKLEDESIYDFNSENSSSSSSFPPTTKCYCSLRPVKSSEISLVDIKHKINGNEYYSLQDFNYDMNNLISSIASDDLSTAYKEFLSETFPWFQNETKACTDALEEAMCGEEMGEYTHSTAIELETDQKVPSIDIPLDDIEDYFYEAPELKDVRSCMFCRAQGEGLPLHESRLLYCGQNNWAHTNCALWSAEVFEEIDGSLQNVHSAASRGRLIKCCHCGLKGATVGCNVKNCGEHYHFPCARQLGCIFMQDKTVYCTQHASDASKKKCQVEKSFEINRSVYVELDRRKKKFVEPGKVQFMIGSLIVKKLGHIVPMFSDHQDVIIPTDFECTRLYWSSKEPWKIVEYRIKTTIQNNNFCNGTDFGRNFTVDHSLNSNLVQWGLTQISKWHSSINSDEQDMETSYPTVLLGGNIQKDKQMRQILEGTGDDTNDEEPQNNNDLLPQEIKDAIFEDIPHDILDGISMLDILPKLMTYDDLIAMDLKNENNFNAEILKEVGSGSSSSNSSNSTNGSKDDDMEVDEDDINDAIMKCSSGDFSNDGWMKSISAPGIEDALLSAIKQPSTSRELKRSKSDLLSRAVAGGRVANQRSSSFSWSSKIESTAAVVAKRRKISKLADVLSLGRLKDESTVHGLERRKSLPNEEFSWSAAKKPSSDTISEGVSVFEKLKISQLDGMDDFCGDASEMKIYSSNMMEAPVKCDRCQATYRNQESYQRHLNSCEVLSTSESDSETRSPRLLSPEQQQAQVASQLNAGTFILPQTSSAGSITTDMFGQINQNHANISVISGLNNQTLNLNNLNGQTVLSNIPASMPITINQLSGIPIQTSTGTQQIPLQGTLSNIGGNMLISNSGQIFAQPVNFQQTIENQQSFLQNKQRFLQPTTSNPLGQTISLSNNMVNSASGLNVLPQHQQQIISIGPNGQPQIVTVTAPQTQQQAQHPTMIQQNTQKKQLIFPNLSPKKQVMSKVSQSPQPIKSKKPTSNMTASGIGKSYQIKKQEPIAIQQAPAQQQTHTIQTIAQPVSTQTQQQQQIQLINASYPLIRPASAATPQQTNTATTNPIIFQQPTNQPLIVQQVGGNQISYVTDQNPVQYLAPTNVLTQNGFTMTTASDAGALTAATNNILIPNGTGGYSMIPASALQLATPQPQVIGTIIQPQATTIQCGMMSTEQMVLGAAATPTLEMVTDPASGCMYLTSPSVYYGLETIVQNTVMSSQQFVSTAMQGVLSQNSSFSATTTQVFQASKIEPIVEVPTGYVVLNNDGTTTQQSLAPMQIQTPGTLIQSAQIQQSPTPTPVAQTIPTAVSATQPSTSMQAWKIEPQTTFVQPQTQSQTTSVNPIRTTPSIKGIVPKAQSQLVNKVMPNTLIKNSSESIISSVASQKMNYHVVSSSGMIYTTDTALTSTTTKVANVIKPITKTTQLNNKPKIVAKPVKQKQPLMSPPLNTSTSSQITHGQQMPAQQPSLVNLPIGNTTQSQLVHIKPNINDKTLLNQPTNVALGKANITTVKNVADLNNSTTTKSISLLKKPFSRNNLAPPFQNNLSQAQQSIQMNAPPGSNFVNVAQQNVGQKPSLPLLDSNKKPSQITVSLATSSTDITQCIPSSISAATTSSITITPTQTASITLPTAPYPMPLYSNIPTNVVNPIQQSIGNVNSTASNNGPVQSRPTNRVLPMQASSILPKSPEVPQTPPPLKLLNASPDKKEGIIPNIVSSPDSPTIEKLSVQKLETEETPKEKRFQIEIKPIDMINSSIATPPVIDDSEPITSPIQQNFQQPIEPTFHLNLNLDQHGIIIPITTASLTTTTQSCSATLSEFETKSPEISSVPLTTCYSINQNEVNEMLVDDSLDVASVDSPSLNDESESPEIKNKISEILDNLEQQTNEDDAFNECKRSSSSTLLPKIEEESVLEITTTVKQEAEKKLMEELNLELSASANVSPEHSTQANIEMIVPIFKVESKNNNEFDTDQKENMDPICNVPSPIASTSSSHLNAHEIQPEAKIKLIQPTIQKPPKSNSPKLLYEIQSQDGFTYKSTSITEIWNKLFEAVQIARKAHGLQPLPEGQLEEMAGIQMLGLKTNAIRYLLEQLPGVEKCSQYKPQYHKKPTTSLDELTSSIYADYFDDIKENAYGSARCEPYSSRSEYDMFSWLASRHRKQPPMPVVTQNTDDTVIPRRGSGSNLPMAMRYRTLKETSKESVGVYRSHIHGRGLFCNRDIEAGEMVIEYAGELIRSTLTDKRERYYDSRGIGCYMFKIDENFVVDATMRGNAARFINHSCEPNCYSKVVDILGHKHIIIFALRRIVQGEELTYDYKFPFEDVKIPCSCGSKKCRKYLN
ncbi:histone-lysine N-methyltransferase trithorax, partial [Uranotaenia lowii]|uniref:histone-lysine N-methyltransferase trithorax n=1 Tax=Uranotaenia lowii TaxID=190385 RepID=UPI0024796722